MPSHMHALFYSVFKAAGEEGWGPSQMRCRKAGAGDRASSKSRKRAYAASVGETNLWDMVPVRTQCH